MPEYTWSPRSTISSRVTANYDAACSHVSSSLVGPIQDQAYYRETLPSHNIVDLRNGCCRAPSGARTYVVTNLTNKLAALTIDNTVFAWQQPTITRVSTNQPRTIGVDFNLQILIGGEMTM